MADTDVDWRRWGEEDPYFAILTHERFRRGSVAAHLDEFFDSGKRHITTRLALAHHYFGAFLTGRALDFGCGVGRLTLPLAEKFDQVIGLDISPAMLAEARKNAADRHLDNVVFAGSDDALTQAPGPFDFVHSYIVLQHIPVKRGMAIIRRMLERVTERGVASLHVGTDRREAPRQRLTYWARTHVPVVHGLLNLRGGRRFGEPILQMNEYPVHKIVALAESLGFGPSIVAAEDHGGVTTLSLLAQRERVVAG